MCAKRLATESLTRGSGDNIAVVVAFLQPVRACFGIPSPVHLRQHASMHASGVARWGVCLHEGARACGFPDMVH